MKPRPRTLLGRLDRMVWGPDPHPGGRWSGRGQRVARTVVALVRDIARGQLTLRAMSLVYTTLLSLVPLLALSFSVLKAFGVSDQIQPVLLNFMAPLGEKGVEVALRIVQFIENMNVGVLGTVGLALLVYTSISLMQKIEDALNYIWHIPRPRPLGERFSRYLSVLMIGPVLVVSALGITATVLNVDMVQRMLEFPALGLAVEFAGRLVPYLMVIAAFTFVYAFIPNTRVRIPAALAGGVAGGIAWQTAGWGFALFVSSSNTYSAIYAGFAIVLLFMLWLYVSWLIVLFGASVAFYAQHPEYLVAGDGEPVLSHRMSERLALAVMTVVVRRFVAGERLPSQPELAHELGVPPIPLQSLLHVLEDAGIVVSSADEPPLLLPARDLSQIRVADLLAAVRRAGEGRRSSVDRWTAPQPADAVAQRIDDAVAAAVRSMSVRDLATSDAPAEGPAAAPGAPAPPSPLPSP